MLTQHIACNKEKLNLQYLSEALNVSYTLMIAAIENKIDEKGRRLKLPRQCLPELVKFFQELIL